MKFEERQIWSHLVVFDKNLIKTKSQLTDIWNKANQTVKAEPTPEVKIPKEPNKTSGVAKSIEAKAIEQGMIEKGYDKLAEFQGTTFKEQAQKVAELMKDVETAKAIARGEKPLPNDIRSGAMLEGLEQLAKQTKDANLMYDLANSPLATKVSEAASELSLAGMREPDSVTMKLKEIKKAKELRAEKRKSPELKKVAKSIKEEVNKVNLSKEDLEWDKFLGEIKC